MVNKMKRKFLITNDVGLAKDKISALLGDLKNEDCSNYLDDGLIEDIMIEVLGHLEQALDNLVFEEEFDND